MLTINQKTLSNGLRIITAPMHETKAVTVLIFVGVGSRFEDDKLAGISHFLEHMFFKGTKKRPTYKEICEELDYLGGDYNAFTSKEYTGYFVQAAADKFPQALDILSDMFFNSTFPESEIAREQGVIIEEINMYEDQPMSKVLEESEKLTVGNNHLGRQIIGTKKTVRSIGRQDLVDYHQTMYSPKNTIVAVAGSAEKFDWANEIEKIFGKWTNPDEPDFTKWQEKQTKPRAILTTRQLDQAHFVLSFPTFSITDPRRPALKVMANLLGGMMSSRLFDEIREKRGLAYYVRSDIEDYHDTGVFYIRAGVVVEKLEEAVKVTLAELDKISSSGISKEELKRSQENIKGNVYLGLEDSQSVIQYLSTRLLYHNEVKQPEEIVAEIEAVTIGDVQKLAGQIFDKSKRNLAVIGPFKDTKKIENLIN